MILLADRLLLPLAAILAVLLARRRADHRPVAVALCIQSGASLVRLLLHRALLGPAPFTGWPRVAFHLSQSLTSAGNAAFAWCCLAVLCSRRSTAERPARAGWIAGWVSTFSRRDVVHVWIGFSVVCIARYPELRGAALVPVYLAAELAALLVWALASVHAARADGLRGLVGTPARVVVTLLGAISLGALAGPWTAGLYDAAYSPQQASLLVLYTAIVLVHLVALRVS